MYDLMAGFVLISFGYFLAMGLVLAWLVTHR